MERQSFTVRCHTWISGLVTVLMGEETVPGQMDDMVIYDATVLCVSYSIPWTLQGAWHNSDFFFMTGKEHLKDQGLSLVVRIHRPVSG